MWVRYFITVVLIFSVIPNYMQRVVYLYQLSELDSSAKTKILVVSSTFYFTYASLLSSPRSLF
jgi:hypothetical protein